MSPTAHLEPAEVEAVLGTGCPPEVFFRRLFHLYLCAVCRKRLLAAHPVEGRALLRQAWGEEAPLDLAPAGATETETAGSPILEAAVELEESSTEFLRQQAEAPVLAEELLRYPPGQRQLLIRNASRFQSLGLAEWLLDESRRSWHGEVIEAEHLARLALLILDELPSGARVPLRLAHALEVRAWAYLGNALRIASRLSEADHAFEHALSHAAEEAELEPGHRAELLFLLSALRDSQGQLDEALELCEVAIAIHLDEGDATNAARLTVRHAFTLGRAGRQEEAIAKLRDLLSRTTRADVGESVYLAALQGLATWLTQASRTAEARELLPEIRGLLPTGRDRLNHLRVDWLEALVLEDEGELEAAEAKLLAARRAFAAAGIPFDVALVSLDLAVLYLHQGRTAEVRRLAEEMIPLFESRAIHREALAALRLFHEAAARDAATVALAQEAAATLRTNTPTAGLRR